MKLDFDDRDQVTDYVSIPGGTYLCRVTDIRERLTKSEDTMWALRLSVAEGEFTGRDAAWDNLVFSSRGLNRVRTVFQAFGLPANGRVDVVTADLMGREAFVTVRPSEYLSATGSMVRRNEVPYDGYQAVEDRGEADAEDEEASRAEDLPF